MEAGKPIHSTNLMFEFHVRAHPKTVCSSLMLVLESPSSFQFWQESLCRDGWSLKSQNQTSTQVHNRN